MTVDSLASTRPIFLKGALAGSADAIYIFQDSTSSGRIVARIRDSAGTTTTLTRTAIGTGVLLAWMLTKNSAGTYTLWANGSSTTGTLGNGILKTAAVASVVGGDATNFYDGKMDFLRLSSICKTDQQDGYVRLINTWSRAVLADYAFEGDSVGDIQDRSPFGLHASVQGSLALNATSLAVNPAPIQVMQSNLTRQNKRQVVLVAGGTQYEGDVS